MTIKTKLAEIKSFDSLARGARFRVVGSVKTDWTAKTMTLVVTDHVIVKTSGNTAARDGETLSARMPLWYGVIEETK